MEGRVEEISRDRDIRFQEVTLMWHNRPCEFMPPCNITKLLATKLEI